MHTIHMHTNIYLKQLSPWLKFVTDHDGSRFDFIGRDFESHSKVVQQSDPWITSYRIAYFKKGNTAKTRIFMCDMQQSI